MPTVHLSLPSQVYEELQEIAKEMGVSVTGLIKMFIREGLERMRAERLERMRSREDQATEVLMQVLARLDQFQRMVEERLTVIEGDLYRLRATVNTLKKRVNKLEDMVEERLYPVEVDTGSLYEAST